MININSVILEDAPVALWDFTESPVALKLQSGTKLRFADFMEAVKHFKAPPLKTKDYFPE